jgi:hypothetical protein
MESSVIFVLMYKYLCIVYLYIHRIKYAKPYHENHLEATAFTPWSLISLFCHVIQKLSSDQIVIIYTVFWEVTAYRLVLLCKILFVLSQKTIFSILNKVRTKLTSGKQNQCGSEINWPVLTCSHKQKYTFYFSCALYRHRLQKRTLIM